MAFLAEDGTLRLETVASKPGEIEPRLLDIMRRINKRVGEAVGAPVFKPALVVIEGLSMGSFGSTTAVLELAALHFLIRIQLYSQGIPFKICSPSGLKKFVLGSTHVDGPNGKKQPAKKEHMLKAVLQRWGVDTTSNDEADAAGLAYVGAAILDRIPAKNGAQREVVEKILSGPVKKQRKMRNRAEMA
jgi:Holliday junction resolvasome RuvABC endonuclease subunit